MILIISYSGGSVNDVIDWIIPSGVEFHRLNSNLDTINLESIILNNNTIDIELDLKSYGKKTKLSDYTAIWIWHGNLNFYNALAKVNTEMRDDAIEKTMNSLSNHHTILKDFFSEYLNLVPTKVLGNFKIQNLNKLEILLRAKQLGIRIPETAIYSRKNQIEQLLASTNIITKPYHEVNNPIYNDIMYQNFTANVTPETLDLFDESIFPSMFQERIEKIYEIRSFFLLGKFYSMAIFSQESSQTAIDFRNYNFEKPNRTVPVNLPIELEEKLLTLFNNLNLNTGSVDLIYTQKDEYIFLEINPVGQFGMVSMPCNYYLEKRVSEYLIHE